MRQCQSTPQATAHANLELQSLEGYGSQTLRLVPRGQVAYLQTALRCLLERRCGSPVVSVR